MPWAAREGLSNGACDGRVLALLPGEPAGRISTRNAGAISFRTTLSWCPGEDMPTGPILGDLPIGARFYSLVRIADAAAATRRISCEIRALYPEQLTAALDAVLRSVTAYATLTEAVLETRAVRLANPSVAPAPAVETLARQLLNAGLRPSFGLSWTPAPGADVSVGTRGSKGELESFLRAYSIWQLLHRY